MRQYARSMIGQRVAVITVMSLVLGISGPSHISVEAAPPIQQPLEMGAEQPVVGTLDGVTPQVSYAFECHEEGIASVYAETTAGDLMVEIAVVDPDALTITTGQIEQKNPNISIAEAFIMPADGQCMVTLSRVGETAGTYALRLLPGYAQLDKWDAFDGAGPPLRMVWAPYLDDVLDTDIRNQRLDMTVMMEGQLGYVLPEDEGLNWTDVYVQADFVIDGDPSYYEYGFLLRSDYAGNSFYTLTVSGDGDWSYFYLDADWYEIQPWTVAPAIDGSDKQPRLGAWMQGNTVKLYFNDRYVGEVSDPSGFAVEGLVGLVVATGPDQMDFLTAHIDNLVITRPFGGSSTAGLPFGQPDPTATPGGGLTDLLGGDTKPTPTPGSLFGLGSITKTPEQADELTTPTQAMMPTPLPLPTAPPLPTYPPTATPAGLAIPTLPPLIRPTETPVPQALTLRAWDSDSPADIVRELREYDLVPSGGELSLTVPGSFGDTSRAGFNFYPLGQGRTFRDFVLTFDARLDMGAAESGCGMHFRNSASSTSMGMVFADGSAYLAQWLSDGDTHESSWYGDHPVIAAGIGVTNRVTMVAIDTQVLMFVNGEMIAAGNFDDASGTIALELYVEEDDAGGTQRTYCQLNDIWLWEF